MRSLRYLLSAVALWAASSPALSAEPPKVVASIKPVHSLVAGVMAGVGEPHLLVRGGGSPHSYGLRPSDARALAGADLVFWIGREMETFLERPLATLAHEARVVALSSSPGLTRLGFRDGLDEDEAGHEHVEHGHGEVNMHLWLDPTNAVVMVDEVAAALAEVDPGRAGVYNANAADLKVRLDDLDGELGRLLQPLESRPFVVFHDAFGYLVSRYGLTSLGAITLSPDRAPGAARIAEVRRKIKDSGALCVFAEPQFEPKLVRTVISGSGAKAGVLDPLGAEIADGPALYFELMRANANALRTCLLAPS